MGPGALGPSPPSGPRLCGPALTPVSRLLALGEAGPSPSGSQGPLWHHDAPRDLLIPSPRCLPAPSACRQGAARTWPGPVLRAAATWGFPKRVPSPPVPDPGTHHRPRLAHASGATPSTCPVGRQQGSQLQSGRRQGVGHTPFPVEVCLHTNWTTTLKPAFSGTLFGDPCGDGPHPLRGGHMA